MRRTNTERRYTFGDLRWEGDSLDVGPHRSAAGILPDRASFEHMHIYLSNGDHVRVPLGEARPTAQKLALEMLNGEQRSRRKSA
jgi:hypothetical protein